MKVRLKKEIVTIGSTTVNPNKYIGSYIEPSEWNEFISDPNTILIDTRNEYEVSIGTFKGAINPETKSYSENQVTASILGIFLQKIQNLLFT